MGATTARGKRTTIAGACLGGLTLSLLVAGCSGGGKAISNAAATVSGSSGTSSPPATTASTTAPATTASTTASTSPSTTAPTTTTPTPTTHTSALASWASSLSLASYSPDSGQTVGVGMPVRVQFNSAVSPADRAAVEKAMRVTTTPHVDGAWSWLNSTTVDFRPQGYWPAHTHVSVHLGLADVKTPDGTHGSAVRDFTFAIGDDHEVVVDAGTHQMTVTADGRVVRSMPTGTGKPGYDTDGGTMVVLGKIPVTRMTSCGIGLSCTPGVGDYYDLTVHNNVQLTNQGIFIHQAEWDSRIGSANTSHGCIHLKPADASWFYGYAQVGDPVKVVNVPHTVKLTNGYGDYTLSWSDWLAGSAAGVQAG
jgi:lipoprotein-anchoring transpeptidase ErfK/SrfK